MTSSEGFVMNACLQTLTIRHVGNIITTLEKKEELLGD